MFSCHGSYSRWANPLPRTFWTGHRIKWLKWGLFVFGCTRGISVPWPRIKPVPLVLGAQSLKHWTTREVLEMRTFCSPLPGAPSYPGLPLTGCCPVYGSCPFRPPQTRWQAPWGPIFCFILFTIVSPVLRINNLNFLGVGITFDSVSKHCMVSSSSYQEICMEKPCVAIYFQGQSRKDVKSLQRFEDDITHLSINISTV